MSGGIYEGPNGELLHGDGKLVRPAWLPKCDVDCECACHDSDRDGFDDDELGIDPEEKYDA